MPAAFKCTTSFTLGNLPKPFYGPTVQNLWRPTADSIDKISKNARDFSVLNGLYALRKQAILHRISHLSSGWIISKNEF